MIETAPPAAATPEAMLAGAQTLCAALGSVGERTHPIERRLDVVDTPVS